jgi:hypothetical protein
VASELKIALGKIRFLFSAFALLSILYFFLTRIPRSWRSVFFEEALYTHIHEIKSDWPRRILAGFVLGIFWIFVFWVTKKKILATQAGSKNSALEFIFGCLGLGSALYLSLALFSSSIVDSAFSIWIVWIPFSFFLFWPQKFSSPQIQKKNTLGILGILLAIFFLTKVTTQFLYSALLKPTGTWDEATMWWPSLQYFSHHGLHQYFTGFSNRGYDPGHLILSSSVLAPMGGSAWIFSSSNFTAFFFGFFTLSLLIEKAHLSKRPAGAGIFLFFLYALMVSSQGGWISVLQWRPGNSDSIAALVCTLLFLLLAQNRKTEGKITIQSAASFLGMGFFLPIIKPPLSNFALPLVLGFGFWSLLFDKAPQRNKQIRALGIVLLGTILAKILWTALKAKYSIHSYYELEWAKLLQPKWNPQAALVVSLLYTTYRIQFTVFLLMGLLSFLRKKQRYLIPYFLVSFGFIGSIIWLYLTLWPTTEHESAGRYFTHTLLAWVWLYAIMELRFFLAAGRLGKYYLKLFWQKVRKN